jgi:poly-D-alanine transfer protein DltD
MQKDTHDIQNEFRGLQEYDIVIISDVNPKYCDVAGLKRFLEDEVREKVKSLILTGGFGLTRKYSDL